MDQTERVEVFIPKGYAGEDPNYLVSINGMNYLLPRGKKSLVPLCVAGEIQRSQRAQNLVDQRVDALASR